MAWRRVQLLWRHRRVRRLALGGALVGIFLACLGTLIAVVQARAAPGWWMTITRDDPAFVALGLQVENGVINRAFKKRPADAATGPWRSEPWTIEVSAVQANAWLNARLPKWLANQKDDFHWPGEVSDLQVDFAAHRVTIGARLKKGERNQVLTATLEPRLEEDGRLFLPARWVNVGRLSIPADWVLERAHRNADQFIPAEIRKLPETESLFRAFGGTEAIMQHAVVRLGDGRLVRLLSFEPRDGVLRVTCQTEMQ